MNRDIVVDPKAGKLIFLSQKPTPDYWNSVHGKLVTKKNISRGDRFVVSETRKVLSRGARVIDAGCGCSATVFGLDEAGFEAEGIDYDVETIKAVNAVMPELRVKVGDIFEMPFSDSSLKGVWSLGVIEHFIDGYDDILRETNRVLECGGFLFLTVPSISPLKRLKWKLSKYPVVEESDMKRFFQYGLSENEVIRGVSGLGYEYLGGYGRSGALGLYEDAPLLAKTLGLRLESEAIFFRILWRLWDTVLTPLTFHTRFYLFQKIRDLGQE